MIGILFCQPASRQTAEFYFLRIYLLFDLQNRLENCIF